MCINSNGSQAIARYQNDRRLVVIIAVVTAGEDGGAQLVKVVLKTVRRYLNRKNRCLQKKLTVNQSHYLVGTNNVRQVIGGEKVSGRPFIEQVGCASFRVVEVALFGELVLANAVAVLHYVQVLLHVTRVRPQQLPGDLRLQLRIGQRTGHLANQRQRLGVRREAAVGVEDAIVDGGGHGC